MIIGYNFFIDKEAQRHRYIQIGVEDEDGAFSGLVIDYVGGGEYGSFYILNDDLLADIEDYEDCDDDEFEDMLDEARPGLMSAINDIMEKYVDWDSDSMSYTFTDAFQTEFQPESLKDNALIGTQTIAPCACGNTDFETD